MIEDSLIKKWNITQIPSKLLTYSWHQCLFGVLFIHFYQHNFYKKTPDVINYSNAGILSLDSPDCCLSGSGRRLGLPFANGNGIFI